MRFECTANWPTGTLRRALLCKQYDANNSIIQPVNFLLLPCHISQREMPFVSWGPFLALTVQELLACTWVNTEGWIYHPHGDACVVGRFIELCSMHAYPQACLHVVQARTCLRASMHLHMHVVGCVFMRMCLPACMHVCAVFWALPYLTDWVMWPMLYEAMLMLTRVGAKAGSSRGRCHNLPHQCG